MPSKKKPRPHDKNRHATRTAARAHAKLAKRPPDELDLTSVPIPKEFDEPWLALRASRAPEAVQRAIYRATILDQPWKEAIRIEQVDRQLSWGWARRVGLAGRSRANLLRGYSRVAALGQDILEERLVEDADAIPTGVVAKVTEVASSQLQKAHESDTPSGYLSVLDALAQRIREGATLRLEVSGSDAGVLDVTPTESRPS